MSLVQQPLLIGAWIGLMHAFDADHLSTLSSLAVRERQRSVFAYAARWACGHAVAIGALGTLALGLGILWVASLSHYAELAVAVLLIALGLNTLRGRRPAGSCAGQSAGGRHATGLGMGLLHGGAGSAAVLAILPLTGFNSSLAAFGFLLSFSLGVAAGALLFAALFSGLLARTIAGGDRIAFGFAGLIGSIAILVGGYMLLGALDAGL